MLNVCFPYTSRDEITHLIKSVVDEATKGIDITEEAIDRHLYTKDVPPLDLLVRTSGTFRLSDFLYGKQCRQNVPLCLSINYGRHSSHGICSKYCLTGGLTNTCMVIQMDMGLVVIW